MDALRTHAEATYSTLLYLTQGFLPLHSVSADHLLATLISKAAGIALYCANVSSLRLTTTAIGGL